jgi:hypothetical protein
LGDSCGTVRARQKAPRRRTWSLWGGPRSTRPPSAVTLPLDPDAEPAVRLGRPLAGLARGDGPGWRAGCGLGEPGRRRAPVGGRAAGGGEETSQRGRGRGRQTRGSNPKSGRWGGATHTLPEGVWLGSGLHVTKTSWRVYASCRQEPVRGPVRMPAPVKRGARGVAGQASGPALTAYFSRAGFTSCDLMAYPSQWDGLSITPTNLQLDS